MIKSILENIISTRNHDIISWFDESCQNKIPCIYSSVDIRYSGNKIVPVDTNLFPAGFNNLDQPSIDIAAKAFKSYLDRYFPSSKKILIITENHTRNLYYLDNLLALAKIVNMAGYEGSLANFDIDEDLSLVSASGEIVKINKINHINDDTDLILLNNDLTAGIPEQLKNCSKIIIPDVNLGWHKRRKSGYFDQYNVVAAKFAKDFNIDPFLITSLHNNYQGIDFKSKESLVEMALGIDQMMMSLKQKYQEHGISHDPYVFIKSDMGTYGMGIMIVKSGDELLNINKSTRNKMNIIKNGVLNSEVIIQEGIVTIDNYQNFPCEKMIYCISGNPIAQINRFNEISNQYNNLNAKGMKFQITPNPKYDAYSLIAQLACLGIYNVIE